MGGGSDEGRAEERERAAGREEGRQAGIEEARERERQPRADGSGI
jgi:hypothetical protein